MYVCMYMYISHRDFHKRMKYLDFSRFLRLYSHIFVAHEQADSTVFLLPIDNRKSRTFLIIDQITLYVIQTVGICFGLICIAHTRSQHNPSILPSWPSAHIRLPPTHTHTHTYTQRVGEYQRHSSSSARCQ